MANTKSAKKAIRSSARKYEHNQFWKRRIRQARKNIETLLKDGANADILKENLSVLQKLVDKAAKEQVIHKNKANRFKTRYAKKISAHGEKGKTTKSKKATEGKKTTTKTTGAKTKKAKEKKATKSTSKTKGGSKTTKKS